MKYNQPIGEAEGAGYRNADPANQITGSRVPAAALEAPQREIVSVINASGSGLTPSSLDNTQLNTAIDRLVSNKYNALNSRIQREAPNLVASSAEWEAGTATNRAPSVAQAKALANSVSAQITSTVAAKIASDAEFSAGTSNVKVPTVAQVKNVNLPFGSYMVPKKDAGIALTVSLNSTYDESLGCNVARTSFTAPSAGYFWAAAIRRSHIVFALINYSAGIEHVGGSIITTGDLAVDLIVPASVNDVVEVQFRFFYGSASDVSGVNCKFVPLSFS